jgi:hypothetical protein
MYKYLEASKCVYPHPSSGIEMFVLTKFTKQGSHILTCTEEPTSEHLYLWTISLNWSRKTNTSIKNDD